MEIMSEELSKTVYSLWIKYPQDSFFSWYDNTMTIFYFVKINYQLIHHKGCILKFYWWIDKEMVDESNHGNKHSFIFRTRFFITLNWCLSEYLKSFCWVMLWIRLIFFCIHLFCDERERKCIVEQFSWEL